MELNIFRRLELKNKSQSSFLASLISVAVTGLFAVGCQTTNVEKESTEQVFSQYESQAKELVSMIQGKHDDREDIKRHAQGLMETGIKLSSILEEQHPECKDYWQAARFLQFELNDISIDELESKYHKDKGLPKADDKCYHVKDLFVHPATVTVLASKKQTGDRAQMSNEINEVLGHMAVSKQMMIR